MKTNPPTGQFSRRKILGAAALGAGAAVVAPLLGGSPASARTLTGEQTLGRLTAGGSTALSDVTPQDVPVYLDTTATLDERVKAILVLMTSDQKLACLNGLPATVLADGYHLGAQGSNGVEGLHGSGEVANATMFPQAIGLGSTWDTELIEEVGHVVGFEVRSRSTSSLRAWAPVADVRANPLAGRFEEGYGEDPFLCGTLGTAYAFGIKGRDPFYILAKPELKHFFAYNHEWNRARSSSSMSSRSMYEFNIVSYRMPIETGAALGAMTSYNLINGVPSNVGPMLQAARGWAPGNFMFVSDAWDEFNLYNTKGAPYVWPLVRPAAPDTSYAAGISPDPSDDATNRNTTAALLLLSGLSNFSDGNGAGFNGSTAAKGAVAAGLLGVSMAQVDRLVRDWLAYKIRTGALDGDVNPYNSTVIPVNQNPQNLQSSKDLALLAAQEQFVLLKNEKNTLPLAATAIDRIAVIGPLGDVNLRDYYSPRPADSLRVTPLQGITAKLSAGQVTFANGCDIVGWRSVEYGTFVTAGTGSAAMTAAFAPTTAAIDGGYKLKDKTYVGAAQAFEIYDWGYDQSMFRSVATGSYINADQAIINSATQLRTSQATMVDAGVQWNTNETFHYLSNSDGSRSIYGVDYIEDDQFYRRYTTGRFVQVGTDAARTLAPTLDYAAYQAGDETVRKPAKFTEYVLQDGAKTAAALAEDADYAIVVIGNEVAINARESKDRPGLALSPSQSALVKKVAAARPGRTIVVITSSYPYAVQEIQDNKDVAAILYTSHAGQSAGTALADVLFGDYAPAGRVSASWLADESSLPKMGPDADGHDATYTVDMLEYDQISAKLTYRYSEAPVVYPFGHGLTYPSFNYKKLSVPKKAQASFDITFNVVNKGLLVSDEVVQVYLHSRDSAYGDRVPVKQLAGFRRVKAIEPGETRKVTVTIDPQTVGVWDVITQQLVVETGDYDVMVGASSADIRLAGTVAITGKTIGKLDLSTARNAWEVYTISDGVSHWEVSKQNTLARQGGYYAVASRRSGDYVGFTNVKMAGVNGIELRVATTTASWANVTHPKVEVRIDHPDGQLLGTVSFQPTTGLQDFTTASVPLLKTSGAHDLYLVFKSGGIYLDTVALSGNLSGN